MSKTIAAVLSAGKGARMQSSLPKVLHLLKNKPLIQWSLEAFINSTCEEVTVVVSPSQPDVFHQIELIKHSSVKPIKIAFQNIPKGTGDAVKCAVESFSHLEDSTTVCIGFGDTPCASADLISSFIKFHKESFYDFSIMAFRPSDPKGYGRVFLNNNGEFERIVEEKDCTIPETSNTLCNSGFVVANLGAVKKGLLHIKPNNSQGEYYLTDIPLILKSYNNKIGVYIVNNSLELLGVNTPEQLKNLENLISSKN